MKILMLCDFYNESLEYQENLLTKYYTKHGYDVTVIASTYDLVFDLYTDNYDNNASAKTYYDGKAKIIKLRNKYKIRIGLMNRLRIYENTYQVFEEECPDLIYIHDIMPDILSAIKYKKLHPHCKIIMDYHADYSNSGKNWLSLKILHGVIRKWILDQARPHLSKIFPIVPAGATFLNEIYGVPYSEMELLPLGADTDLGQLTRTRKMGQQLRESFGISTNETIIFTGGKLNPAKKTELLIDAFKLISRPDLHLFIVGDASEIDKEYKNQLLNQANGIQNIHFTGWLSNEDIYPYLDMADMAVFPASQSILWQQAISMGLPLIVGDLGHQDPSYLNKYGNIIILSKEDIRSDKIFEAIQSLITNPSRIRQMRTGAERVTDELLNWDKLVLKTLRFNQDDNPQLVNMQLDNYSHSY
jgi:1,2-diacylglycerol 3-alpha-glucosyltransferase